MSDEKRTTPRRVKRTRRHMIRTLWRVYRRWRRGNNPHLRLTQMLMNIPDCPFYMEDHEL